MSAIIRCECDCHVRRVVADGGVVQLTYLADMGEASKMVPASELERAERECVLLRHLIMLDRERAFGPLSEEATCPVGRAGEALDLEGRRLYYASARGRDDEAWAVYSKWLHELKREALPPKRPLPPLLRDDAPSPCCGAEMGGCTMLAEFSSGRHPTALSCDPNSPIWRRCCKCFEWVPVGIRQIEWDHKHQLYDYGPDGRGTRPAESASADREEKP